MTLPWAPVGKRLLNRFLIFWFWTFLDGYFSMYRHVVEYFNVRLLGLQLHKIVIHPNFISSYVKTNTCENTGYGWLLGGYKYPGTSQYASTCMYSLLTCSISLYIHSLPTKIGVSSVCGTSKLIGVRCSCGGRIGANRTVKYTNVKLQIN